MTEPPGGKAFLIAQHAVVAREKFPHMAFLDATYIDEIDAWATLYADDITHTEGMIVTAGGKHIAYHRASYPRRAMASANNLRTPTGVQDIINIKETT